MCLKNDLKSFQILLRLEFISGGQNLVKFVRTPRQGRCLWTPLIDGAPQPTPALRALRPWEIVFRLGGNKLFLGGMVPKD